MAGYNNFNLKGDFFMKKLLMLGLAMSLEASLSAADTPVILAKIGSIQISSTEFMQRVKQLPAQYRNFYSSGEGKKLLLNQLVDEKLIYLAASREKYDQRKDVLDDVANAKGSIMASHYVRDQFQKISITDADVQKYYDANQAQFQKPAKVHARHILLETEMFLKELFH
jgi:peptidyl-prolyl cis-trans isomerase C